MEGARQWWQARAKRDPYEQQITLINWVYHSQRNAPSPHLLPEDASQTKGTRSDARAEQANEHDDK
jgi:hypothetical protein